MQSGRDAATAGARGLALEILNLIPVEPPGRWRVDNQPICDDAPPPITHTFTDDGRIPNNPALPLVLYRGGIDLTGSPDPEDVIEKTFAANSWGNMWRNGIYPYAHYHSMIHEAMGIARGRATVRFGGENGQESRSCPATSSSCRPAPVISAWADPTLVVIGAYPPSGKYNLCRGSKAEHAKAIAHYPESAAAGDRSGIRIERAAA